MRVSKKDQENIWEVDRTTRKKKHTYSRDSGDTLPSRRVYFESRTKHVVGLLSFSSLKDHTLFKNRVNELNGVMFVSFLSQLFQFQKWVLI